DSEPELTESVVLTLVSGADYDVRPPLSATLSIIDNERPTVFITADDTNAYERLRADTLNFTFTRLGETNQEIFGLVLAGSGTATPGVDYPDPAGMFISMPAGMVTTTVSLSPFDDLDVEGDETVVITLLAASDYDVGTPSSATAVIRDDEW